MTTKEANKKIKKMINDSNVTAKEVFDFVETECREIQLTPTTLGMLFEIYMVLGDADTKTCTGCYWYSPKEFNQIISEGFIKKK